MIHPDLYQEINRLAEQLRAKFSPPEFIPGCEVMSVTDKNLYAANNGWVEAICGQHNQQRVRWKSNETVIVGSFIDVLYFPDRRLFEAYGLGGAGAIPAGAGWPFATVRTVSATDADAGYTTILLAITAASDGDVILIDAETISLTTTITVNKALTITSLGGTVITSSVAGPTFELTDAAGATLRNLTIRNTGAGAKSGCVKWAVDDVIIDNCVLEKLSGASTVGYCIWQAGGDNSHIIDTKATCNDVPGSNYGYLNDTGDATATITRGTFSGLTWDIFTARAGSTLTLEFVTAHNVSWDGTPLGWRFNTGNLVPFDNIGISLGAWLEKPSSGYRIYYSTLADAITAMGAGDTIHLEAGTYTGPFTLNVNGTLKGSAQGDTILTDNTGVTLTISTAGAIVEDLTVLQTFAGVGLCKAIYITANARLRNVIASSTGAADTGEGIIVSGATVDLINVEATATGATTKIGLDLVSSAVVNVYGGVYGGATYNLLVDTSTITLIDPVLTNSIILSATSTVKGSYRNAAGDIVLVGSSILAGVDKYIISATVASNDLTVALKTLAGTDPTEGSPIFVKIGNVVRPITAALSVTANDGTNWFNSGSAALATRDVDYFVYLIQETGASAGTKIGFARIPYANTMGDFTNTTTSEKYIKGDWTNFNATDPVVVIGRFNAILSATAAFTWSLTTAVIINRPIFITRWLVYTPAVSSQTGTITTVGAVAGVYQVDYNKLFFSHSGVITTNGTGATGVQISLPFTPVADNAVTSGRNNATGAMIQGRPSGALMQYYSVTNAYPAADGSVIIGGGIGLRLV